MRGEQANTLATKSHIGLFKTQQLILTSQYHVLKQWEASCTSVELNQGEKLTHLFIVE